MSRGAEAPTGCQGDQEAVPAPRPQFPHLYKGGLDKRVSREVPESQRKPLWCWGKGSVISVEGSSPSIPEGRWGGAAPPASQTLWLPARAQPSLQGLLLGSACPGTDAGPAANQPSVPLPVGEHLPLPSCSLREAAISQASAAPVTLQVPTSSTLDPQPGHGLPTLPGPWQPLKDTGQAPRAWW